LIDSGLVVGGDEKQAVLFEMLDDVEHVLVVASMSLLDAGPDWGLISVLLSESSLFIHVGASDELDT